MAGTGVADIDPEARGAAKAARRAAARAGGPEAAAERLSPPTRDDMRVLIGAVARFAASFETALRQLEPGLTLSQVTALEAVAEEGGVRPFRLAAQMGISRQLAWQTCKRLEALGLAEMEDRETGRRGVTVTATAAGRTHLGQVHELYDRLTAGFEGEGRRPNLAAVRNTLGRLAAAAGTLNDAADDEAGGGAAAGAGGEPAGGATPAGRRKAGR